MKQPTFPWRSWRHCHRLTTFTVCKMVQKMPRGLILGWLILGWLVLVLSACSSDTETTLELNTPASLVVGETITATARWTGAGNVSWQVLPENSVRIDSRETQNQQTTLQITGLAPGQIVIQAILVENTGVQLQRQRMLMVLERANFEGSDAPVPDGSGNNSGDDDLDEDALIITPVASLTVDALADRYFSVPASGFSPSGFSQGRLDAFETALRQSQQDVNLCAFNATNAEVIAGACGNAEDLPIAFSNPTTDVFAPGRPVLELDVDPAHYAALHVLAYVSEETDIQGYALNLGDSSQNDGFGGSDGERDNAEILWYESDNDPASQLSVYSRADNPSELVQADLLTADSVRGATLHLIVTPVRDGSRVHWRCVGDMAVGDMAACDGQFRASELTPAQLFALGDDATNNQLWLALNRVIAPETSASSDRLGRGITHAVVWLEPRPLPDLVVREATFTETPTGCSLDITIANVGQGDARGNFAFQASPLNLVSGSGIAWSNAIYGLAAGQHVQQRWPNVNASSGTLTISVDPADDIRERDDSPASNTLSRPVPAACQGDVTPFDASISKQLEGTLQAGENARYVINVRTDSPFSQAPTVIDTLPTGVTFVSSPSETWSCQENSGQVRCEYQGNISSGALEPLLLDVRLADDVTGTVRNCARLNQTDRDASNNEACNLNDIGSGSSDVRVSQALQGSLREGRLSRVVVQVSNLGPDALTGNVQMTSTLPQGITFLAGNSAAWRCRVGSAQTQAEQVICDYQGNRPVDVGILPDVIYTVEVASSAAARVTLCSSITADNDTNPSNNRTCDTFDVQRSDDQTSDLTFAKSISGELARGQQGRYVLRVSNVGPAPYEGTLHITDTLPAGVRFVEARSNAQVWRCDISENSNGLETVTCRYLNNDVSVGALPDVTLVVNITEAASEQLENCATLQLEPLDANADNNRACTNRDLGQPAPSGFDVDVSQALIGSVQAGSVAAINVQVANLGSARVDVPVMLSSDLPASVRFVSSDTADGNQQRWTCTVQNPQNQQGQNQQGQNQQGESLECTLPPITDGWEVGSLPPLNVVFEVAEGAPEQLELCFTVLATGDTNLANNRACVSATVQPAEVEPYDLQLDLSLRSDLRVGQTVRYVVQVSNLGSGSATDAIQVQTRLAQGLQLTAIESNEVNARDTWRCQSSGQSDGQNPETITCTADTPPFAVGSLPSLELIAQVDPASNQTSGDVLTTCATVQASGDSNPNNNDACASGTLQARRADVQLSSSVVNTPVPGGRITLALAVRNAGPDAVDDGVTVTTPLPVGFSFVTSNSPAWSCEATRDNVRCDLNAPLAVGDAPGLLLELAITPETSGVVTSCSSVSINQDDITDPNLANNDACQELRVAAPGDLAISKTQTGEVRRGLPAVYTITVTNLSGQAVSRVPNVRDTLPTGLELDFVESDDWTCTLVVGTLDCRYTADTLAASASSTLQLVTNVLEDAPGEIENCAELSLLDQDASNNRSCVTNAVTRVRDLGVSLELTNPLRAASQSTYRITVTRSQDNDIDGDGVDDSSDALAPITVTTSLPRDLQVVGDDFGDWSCDLNTPSDAPSDAVDVVCTLTPTDASMAANTIPMLELPVRVSSNATSPLETCTELAPDRDNSNNRACLEREVGVAFTLSLEKTLLESLDAGSESQYRLVGSVRLPADVADALEDSLEDSDEVIVLRDDLPLGLQLVAAGNSFWDCSQTTSTGSSQLVCESRASLGALIDAADDGNEDDVVLALEPLTLTVRVADDAPGEIENCAELAVLGIVERACSDNPVSRRFDLTISKTLPEEVLEVGDSYAYRIEVENLGPNAAPSPVTVRDVLPLGVRFRNTPEGLNWTCSNDRNVRDTVTCTYSGATAAGTFTNLLLIVDITAEALVNGNPTVIENCAEVLATGETSSSNNRACVSNRVVQ